MAAPKFEVVQDDPPAAGTAAETPPRELGLLLLALKALSQRAIAALADLFFLATAASAWYLWYLTPNPDSRQNRQPDDLRRLRAGGQLAGAPQMSPVQQSGTITPGHLCTWTTDGAIQDGGVLTPANTILAKLFSADFNSIADQAIPVFRNSSRRSILPRS